MNRQLDMKNALSKTGWALLAGLLTASVGMSLPAEAAVPLVSISNIPLTLVAPAHPQVLLAIPNSQSMDGDLSGAIMTGSGASGIPSQLNTSSSPVDFTVPAGFTPPVTGGAAGSSEPYTAPCGPNLCDNSPSRLNVAKAAIQAILESFVGNTDFGLLTYNTGGPTLYTTWLYVMSESGGFTFSATNTPAPPVGEYIPNPCYDIPSGNTVYNDCNHMVGLLGPNLLTMPYMLVQNSSDDPSVNDVLYAGGGIAPVCVVFGTRTPASPFPPHYSLANYNTGGITVSYSNEINGCAGTTGPTNAGFVPYQPQTMYMLRGFGYYDTQSATSGRLLLPLQSAGNNPTPTQIAAVINTFTPYLAPETNNTDTSEIKAQAVQSPIPGLLNKALAYFNTNPPSSNGCPPQRYVIMITDGLPTEDLGSKSWPPLGSASAAGYGVTATFNADGSLATTNDQALTDTITKLTALQAAGVKTFIVGVGAGVDPILNPQAAATLTAMAVAGNTGNYYAATSPAQVALDMTAILSAIQAANMSTSSAAVNSTGLKAGAVAYQAQFTSADTPWQDWTGNLVAYPILSNGTVNTTSPTWAAQTQLDTKSPASRVIATWDPAVDAGIPFTWCSSSCGPGSISQTTALGLDLMTSPTDTLGSNRLDYLRGDRTDEQQNGGTFRNRSHILGDIVDSNPLYVGPPNGPYQDPSYITYELAQASRKPMLYVGANDGMLHAIDPTNGNEQFAFIPNGVFANLINLTKPTYNQSHEFFVDGSPTAGDVQFSDGSWHTILAGGLNAGGNSIYALDVTHPASITNETTLSSDVLWEYTDAYLGLTYGQPVIARTNVTSVYSTTPFVVFFGSGYNNSDGNPYLYAVNAQTGALLTRINLCAAPGVPGGTCISSLPNGLSSPVAVNRSGALALPDDAVYAGDLQGNLWKVDIANANPALWTVQLMFQACSGTPCTSTNRQPITVEPTVSLHPDFPRRTGTVVYFGTGQLLGTPDLTTTSTQSFYAVWDKPGLTTVLNRSNLEAQVLSGPTAGPAGTTVRLITDNPINWSSQYGWYMDLSISGERVVTDPRLESGTVVLTTYVPAASSCAVGGESWLLAVNYQNGGTFPSPQLDLNGDGLLNASDQVAGQNPVGLDLGNVYAAAPTIISANLSPIHAVKLVSESTGAIKSIGEAGGAQQRLSWRELPPN